MPRANCKNELLSFLKEKQKKLNAVVMPDFFFDRLISIDCDVAGFSSVVADVTGRKGGSIDGIVQMDIRGGNAVNTTSALAALGVNVTPIVCTSKLGLQLLNFYLKTPPVDFSHVKIAEKASLTTALEFKAQNGKANVMLRDVGSLADFGPADLNERDYELIESADYVCLFDWAGTKKFGTKLAENVFSRVKTRGKGKTYYDTADPTPNRDKIPDLMRSVLQSSCVDVLSLNENEAICYVSMYAEIRGKSGLISWLWKLQEFWRSVCLQELTYTQLFFQVLSLSEVKLLFQLSKLTRCGQLVRVTLGMQETFWAMGLLFLMSAA
jgi:hypothetical protein